MLRQDFTLIALIGVFLLIGIVKKNAIMMVDFALEAERTQAGAARRDLPGLPDALPSHHDDDHGRHLRRAAADAGHRRRRRDAPAAGHHHRGRLGVEPDPDAHTTPVVYLYLDRFSGPRAGVPAARRPFPQNIHDPQRQAVVFLLPLRGAVALRLAGRLRRRADYQRPALDIGASYKEGQGEVPGWKPAEPRDQVDRGAWWRVYGDATLDGLVERLNASNQTIAQAEANYRQALGLGAARAPASSRPWAPMPASRARAAAAARRAARPRRAAMCRISIR